MSSLKIRLNDLIAALKLSKNEFAREIGTSSAMISKITTKDINFGVDIYQKIISKYPTLNQVWLLTGVGEMWLINEDYVKYSPIKITPYSKPLTIKRSRLLYNSNDKVLAYVRNLDDDLKGLYQLVGDFIVFTDVAKEITTTYFDPLEDIVFDEGKYLDGDKYRLEDCKKDAYKALKKLKPLENALKQMNICIFKFYKEFGKVDSKQVIDGLIGPHVT